jgi:hypothetical protein
VAVDPRDGEEKDADEDQDHGGEEADEGGFLRVCLLS